MASGKRNKSSASGKFSWRPLTRATWSDFEALFGERGACGGCWCMAWRLRHWSKQKGDPNRRAMKALADSGREPGILGYLDGVPVGWCSVAPREEFAYLARSRVLKPVDNQPVWSVTCFFIDKAYRRRGLTVKLLEAAAGFVRSKGGRILEGYPMRSKPEALPPVFAWTGLESAFQQAGFMHCASESTARHLMRRAV